MAHFEVTTKQTHSLSGILSIWLKILVEITKKKDFYIFF